MNGNTATKVGRLVGNLAAHPSYLTRYVSNNVLNKRSPLDLEIPWFSYSAIDFLGQYLCPDMTVCEYGSGGSTVFFARRVKSVLSIEDNPEWFALVTRRLEQLKLENAKVLLCPFDFKNPVKFEKSEYLHSIPDEPCDIYAIDGSEEWDQVRPTCFHLVEEKIRPGGMIIVDDSWRYPELRKRNMAREVKVFQSVGPSRPGVTSTDVFLY